MSSFHDQIFAEIAAARKLAADYATRHGGHLPGTPRMPSAADRLAQEAAAAAEIAALAAEEEERRSRQARERAEDHAEAWAESAAKAEEAHTISPVSNQTESRWSAIAVLKGLAKLRAKERAAAEDLIRQAHQARDAEPQQPAAPVRGMWTPSLGASQVWYFTSQGTRCGPVTFGELRSMAASQLLDPRHDMVWKEGMDGWKQAGLLDGLFERRIVPTETPDKRGGKRPRMAALPKDLTAALASKQMAWPGAGRRSLWLGLLLFPVLWSQLLLWSSPALVAAFGSVMMSKLLPLASFVPLAVLTYLVLMRLVNLGMSRWWALMLAIPVLNLWVGFRCLVCPSGCAYHRKMDRFGIAIAIAVVVLVPALWYINLHHPGLLSATQLQTALLRLFEGAGKIIPPR